MVVWHWRSFEALSVIDLYDILLAREAVFIVEQHCIYQDIDGLDPDVWHLMGRETASGTHALMAYLRVVLPGKKYEEPSIGRVLTTSAARGRGLGQALMAEGIKRVEAHYPGRSIRISAQAHLERFYQGFGFQTVSEPYDEDGIPHIEMLRVPRAKEAALG
ncbi:MAG: acetyltransferase [Candidatus Entotheonella factor]|uniref:Acetyltransferase n=1 Tax=Entotheonella factor TaxID=1429438 RepID=W4LMV2_ENTF1|nr:GNAT family N-acetyltransferase [Candidatus Entotheonella palauensis]ETW99234.1 MAG: acetyltransferase [Candidatus Entotheonella factor]